MEDMHSEIECLLEIVHDIFGKESAIERIMSEKVLEELFQDAELLSHSKKVAYYSLCIFEAIKDDYKLTDQNKKDLFLSALLHDIGKNKIPREILYKPEKVTSAEFEVLKKHPKFSIEVLSHFTSMYGILDNIHHHHERYDGQGYPDRLENGEIPLFARIISIADSFDAMTSHRCYKKLYSTDYALGEILENAGTQFDPQLSETFINLCQTKKIQPGWEF